MAKVSLRTASVYCLVVCAAIWVFFLLIRVSSFDIRVIPGIGPIMLAALVSVILAPIVATGIAVIALVRRPRAPINWLILACALAALFGEGALFTVNAWL
ncbi:MAG TPA: hypothetical protein VGI93_11370 [Steroidobacteraceae bacterium]|jgi:hypothetical protein